jgi:hypothetical protein
MTALGVGNPQGSRTVPLSGQVLVIRYPAIFGPYVPANFRSYAIRPFLGHIPLAHTIYPRNPQGIFLSCTAGIHSIRPFLGHIFLLSPGHLGIRSSRPKFYPIAIRLFQAYLGLLSGYSRHIWVCYPVIPAIFGFAIRLFQPFSGLLSGYSSHFRVCYPVIPGIYGFAIRLFQVFFPWLSSHPACFFRCYPVIQGVDLLQISTPFGKNDDCASSVS